MEPDTNQTQTPRGDYQSIPVRRPHATQIPVNTTGDSPAPATPLLEASGEPLLEEHATLAPVAAQPEAVQQASPVPDPPVSTPTPAVTNIEAPESEEPLPVPPAHVPRPHAFETYQHPEKQRRFWQTRKFCLVVTVCLFVLALVAGAYAMYKGTHHQPDKPAAAAQVYPPVDSSDAVKTVGDTSAEQTANTTRQKAILALRTAVESYYTTNGHYPTTANVADVKWATSNLRSITTDSLKDPSGATAGVVSQPAAGHYAYQAGRDIKMESCDNVTVTCNYYKLTATLSDGTTYVKTALQ